MEQMSLSQVCKRYGFTRRVIQGYEKEGLVRHTGKNKYGHLLYDERQVKRIAYIRYLQANGLTLKEISHCMNSKNASISTSILKISNARLKEKIIGMEKLINKNETIIGICSSNKDLKDKEEDVMRIIMEELENDKTV